MAGSFAIGCCYPPLLATQALTSPAQVRTLSFSFGALFLGLGGVGWLVLFGKVADGHGVHGVQYAIGYTPLNDKKDGTFRKIDIKMANKDLKAQARRGYYASK